MLAALQRRSVHHQLCAGCPPLGSACSIHGGMRVLALHRLKAPAHLLPPCAADDMILSKIKGRAFA